jgi:hypothetical protein
MVTVYTPRKSENPQAKQVVFAPLECAVALGRVPHG